MMLKAKLFVSIQDRGRSMSHVFKHVTFGDKSCTMCGDIHNALQCPSMKSVIEMEVSCNAHDKESEDETETDSEENKKHYSRQGNRNSSRKCDSYRNECYNSSNSRSYDMSKQNYSHMLYPQMVSNMVWFYQRKIVLEYLRSQM